MSKRSEKISAHLDGEIHHDELMSFSLSAEAEDAVTSVRYRLIGDVLRGEVSELSMQDVSMAVHQALVGEKLFDADPLTHSVAGAGTASTDTAGADVPTFNGSASSYSTRWLPSSWLRPLGGMAVAASVAVVMVLAVMQKNEPVVGAQVADAQQATTPVTIASNQALQTAPVQSIPVANHRELDPYLDQHFATQGTLQSRMPYVRAVSYETGE